MAAVQSVRITRKQDRKSPEQTKVDAVSAALPDAKLYGIYGPQYAAALAAKTGATGADIVNRGTLAMMAQRERGDYANEMEAAHRAELKLQHDAAHYGIMKDVAGRNLDYTDHGMGGAERVVTDEYGNDTIQVDPVQQQVANANVLNNDQADRYGVYASGIGNLADAGFAQSPEDIGKLLTPPTQMKPEAYGVYKTPHDTTAAYSADQGLTYEQQLEKARIEATARDHGNEVKGTVVIGANGVAQVQYTGPPDKLAKYGIGPDGKPISPNAGPVGGAAPATPAATAPVKTQKASIRPVSDGRAAVNSVYPQFASMVTQVERDPNSKLGRANPTSWHNHSKAAIDMRPIKGMSFEQYVKGYENAGYHIIEKRDEVKNPSGHATGPHWHVVLGENRSDAVYAQRLRAHPSVAQVQQTDDGKTLVTLKDGSQRVYIRGKRVG